MKINFLIDLPPCAKFSPVVPLVGAKTMFQPVFVDDVAAAAVQGALGAAKPGVYELGGTEVATFEDLIKKMLHVIRRKRLLVNIPFFAAAIKARSLDIASLVTLGLFKNTILTYDQVQSLKSDNVVSANLDGFKKLGIKPVPMESVLDEYLYRHRPYGQYTELTESAKDLSA